LLETTKLDCTRGDKLLIKGLSFNVEKGQLLHITGRNGAGKTTLLRCLCGLSLPAAGSITWDGQNIAVNRDNYHAQMAYVGHVNGNQGDLTPEENLVFAQSLSGQRAANHPVEILDTLGLTHCRHLPTKFLSQGQQRRLALARLLVQERTLWIMDEPFVALDVDTTALLEGIVSDHIGNGGIVILTSHHSLNIDGSSQLNIDHDQL
jgi:heme exporter protein A